MYTVEHDFDETIIHVLDDSGIDDEDLEVILSDEFVCLRQYNTEMDEVSVIIISTDMWVELLCALNSPEGAYKVIELQDK
jgi:hypothetical protein